MIIIVTTGESSESSGGNYESDASQEVQAVQVGIARFFGCCFYF